MLQLKSNKNQKHQKGGQKMGARFSFNDADNYGQQNAGSFFQLKDDKDTARVRFLYNTIDDVEGYVVHQVQVGDKNRYVGCLRRYDEPADKCPLCASGYKQIPKLFVKLYNEDTHETQTWERGKTFFQRISSLASRYNPLCDEIVEIERNGKKGDMQTKYEFYPVENSQFDMDSVECSEPLGSIILDKSADEMQTYLSEGRFPDSGEEASSQRSSEISRRTPQSTGRRSF